jgi:hypothetical protein
MQKHYKKHYQVLKVKNYSYFLLGLVVIQYFIIMNMTVIMRIKHHDGNYRISSNQVLLIIFPVFASTKYPNSLENSAPEKKIGKLILKHHYLVHIPISVLQPVHYLNLHHYTLK